MSHALLEPGTGRFGLEETILSWRLLHAYARPTGWETRGTLGVSSAQAMVRAQAPDSTRVGGPVVDSPAPAADLASRAAGLAAEAPYAVTPLPPAPRLSGNLAEDVRAFCGLTWAQIAEVFGISERAAAGWRTQGVPQHREQTMEALRAIGAILVGGLGPQGVGAWLTAGSPSRLERLRDGEQDAVGEEALSYRDTPAT